MALCSRLVGRTVGVAAVVTAIALGTRACPSIDKKVREHVPDVAVVRDTYLESIKSYGQRRWEELKGVVRIEYLKARLEQELREQEATYGDR